MTYRKIGGMHWLAFGRLRIAFCFKRHYRLPKASAPCWGRLSELG